jgi:hypothetical protein
MVEKMRDTDPIMVICPEGRSKRVPSYGSRDQGGPVMVLRPVIVKEDGLTDIGKWCWHVHHDTLVERLTEPLSVRIAYIRRNKPEHEVPVRLALLHLVKDEAVGPAWKAYDEAVDSARKARDKAVGPVWKAYNEAVNSARKARDEAVGPAWKAYDEAVDSVEKARDKAVGSAEKAYKEAVDSAEKARDEAVEGLHVKECPDCPWDGQTIFPKEVRDEH